ncbi:MAG: cbb3-type cytochrome c oxidase subunit I [Bacteroidota bacterium]
MDTNFIQFLMNPKKWWIPLTIILAVSITGVSIIGYDTYYKAPPIPDYIAENGESVFTHDEILAGQSVFQKYALMEYGSMFGDGANRGPDYTAQALHQITYSLQQYYANQPDITKLEWLGVAAQVQREIKENKYSKTNNQVKLSPAQVYACEQLTVYYLDIFKGTGKQSLKPANYIKTDLEIKQLSAFFFWGSWVCGVERPGKEYSYTHNWPYDATAGNTPSPAVIIWSIIGSLGLMLGLGIVLYYHGKLEKLNDFAYTDNSGPLMTQEGVATFQPTASQRATFKYFYLAILLFIVQVTAGILTVHDFLNFTTFFGYDIRGILPITITRSWHVQLSILWISTCWIGASFFIAPLLSPQEPANQRSAINLIFGLIVILGVGSMVGIYAGPLGIFKNWYWFGHQGWEYVEPGKLWQGLLFVILALWCFILFKALKPSIKVGQPWQLPNWLVYSTCSILVLLLSGFVATPKTNFVIADFWRWCVIHMWAEAFFEVFTTVLVGYFMVLMGLVSKQAAIRVIYIATLLFLGSGLLGISHNFYWNAKPVGTMALGSVFSTLQVIPLILLMLEAWRFQKLPAVAAMSNGTSGLLNNKFGMPEVFLFLIGVNFWNFFGAGVLGFIINLPLANYYEHGTYLTVNHGHAALMGVYGNLSIATILFCSQLLTESNHWKGKVFRLSFWSINIGLLLMVLLDLFPAGILQFQAVVEKGLWFARSAEFIDSTSFQTLTWMRIVGGSIFVVGGVIPLTYAITSAAKHFKKSVNNLSKKGNVIESVKN